MTSITQDIGNSGGRFEERNDWKRLEVVALRSSLAGAVYRTVNALGGLHLEGLFGYGQGWAGIVKEATK